MLPPDWRVALDPGSRRIDEGRVLVGGAPLRLLRLNEAGARVLDKLISGAPIGDGASEQALGRRLLDAGIAHPRPVGATRSTDDVTVIVPFNGASGELAPTLVRIAPVSQVIVVDDGSPDPTVADVAASRSARLERHAVNRGAAAARNTGWRLASTELVAFVDGGCHPDDGWLNALLPHFDDPQVAAVAPRITTAISPTLPPTLASYEAARPSLDRGPVEATVRPRSRVPFVPTATLVVRVADLRDIGGFDEDMRVGEDVDLVWRLVASGRTVRYEPAATVAHISRPNTRAWLRQRFDYGRSTARLATRHGDAVRPLTVSGWTAGVWALIASGSVLPGVALAAGTTALLVPKLEHLQHPWREAARLAGMGHLYGGLAVADALRRPWWPLALTAALTSRRLRFAVAVAATVPSLLEWKRERPALGPVRWTLLRLVDDVSYGTGVWAGCYRERSASALYPALTTWPGRQRAVEPA